MINLQGYCYLKPGDYLLRADIVRTFLQANNINEDFYIRFQADEDFTKINIDDYLVIYDKKVYFSTFYTYTIEVILDVSLELPIKPYCAIKTNSQVINEDTTIEGQITELKYEEIHIDHSSLTKEKPKVKPKRKIKRRCPLIKDMIRDITEWRELYKKGMSLINAAKVMNIPKKTLDDYFSKYNIASKYGFHINDHLNEPIGVIRKFVSQIQKEIKYKVFNIEKCTN